MAIITLTSDLGTKDYYVSAVKGAILSELPDAVIVDITHEIEPFDIFQASYVLKNSYVNFPPGTIHIIGVNAQPDMNVPYVAMYASGHYFIGSDNGMFSLLLEIAPEKIVVINLKQDTNYLNFPIRDVFVKAACHIARGGTLEIIGNIRETFNERTVFRPVIESDSLRGTVIYIDSYGNAISNISKKIFNDASRGRSFVIDFVRYSVDAISESYNQVAEGEIIALFNSAGYLELSINKGKIVKLLNMQLGDIITIRFA